MDITSYFDIGRDYINAYLLTDTCLVYPITYANDGSGSNTETQGSAKIYHGSTNIPCRIDQTRQR